MEELKFKYLSIGGLADYSINWTMEELKLDDYHTIQNSRKPINWTMEELKLVVLVI